MSKVKFTSRNIWSLSVALLLFILCAVTIFTNKTDSFFWLNQYHNYYADIFFANLTFLGDGWASIITGLVLLFTAKRKLGLQILIAYVASGIITQLIKKIVRMPRPKAYLVEGSYNYFIDGITHSGWNSFPSGHTTSIFAMAIILCLYTKNILLRTLYMASAFAVGYSRIYLGQHFLEDVMCGACIGLITGGIVFRVVKLPTFKKKIGSQLNIPS